MRFYPAVGFFCEDQRASEFLIASREKLRAEYGSQILHHCFPQASKFLQVYDYDCHVCGHHQAVYYRLSETIVSDAMAIIYVCCKQETKENY